MLVTALCVDSFVASFGYGANKIKIPTVCALIINGICTLFLGISLLAGSLMKDVLNKESASIICFVVLLFMGLIKLCDSYIKSYIRKHKKMEKQFKLSNLNFIFSIYADPEVADADHSRTLSPAEAVLLAIAMSLDGLAVGVGAALSGISPLFTILMSLCIGFVALLFGSFLGRKVSDKMMKDITWLGGILLIAVAVMKLS